MTLILTRTTRRGMRFARLTLSVWRPARYPVVRRTAPEPPDATARLWLGGTRNSTQMRHPLEQRALMTRRPLCRAGRLTAIESFRWTRGIAAAAQIPTVLV